MSLLERSVVLTLSDCPRTLFSYTGKEGARKEGTFVPLPSLLEPSGGTVNEKDGEPTRRRIPPTMSLDLPNVPHVSRAPPGDPSVSQTLHRRRTTRGLNQLE